MRFIKWSKVFTVCYDWTVNRQAVEFSNWNYSERCVSITGNVSSRSAKLMSRWCYCVCNLSVCASDAPFPLELPLEGVATEVCCSPCTHFLSEAFIDFLTSLSLYSPLLLIPFTSGLVPILVLYLPPTTLFSKPRFLSFIVCLKYPDLFLCDSFLHFLTASLVMKTC